MSLWRCIECGSLLSGMALLLVFSAAPSWAEYERARGLRSLRAHARSIAPHGQTVDGPSTGAAASSVDSKAPAAASRARLDSMLWSAARAREHAEAMNERGYPLGALSIPSLDLEVPIYSGTSELNLTRGAAHIEGTAPPGAGRNVGVAAHRDGYFRQLEYVHLGAEITLEVDARPIHYRVVDIRIVEPTDTYVLAPTTVPSITLVTCYPFEFIGHAPERYIVRAELAHPIDSRAPFQYENRSN